MGLINVLWKGSSVKQDSTNRLVSDSEKSTWNGKANSSHTHITSQITDFGTHVYDATIKRAANTVLAAPNGSAGVASFRKLQITDITNLQSTLDGKASKDDVFVPDFNVPRKTPINLATAGATKLYWYN